MCTSRNDDDGDDQRDEKLVSSKERKVRISRFGGSVCLATVTSRLHDFHCESMSEIEFN
jgi:hypothetical protein